MAESAPIEDDLPFSEDTYDLLFNNLLNGIAHCKMLFENEEPLDFIYLKVNKAFETLTGLTNVVGRKATEVIPGIRENDFNLFEIYARVSLTGKPERFEKYVETLKMWFLISVYGTKHEHFVAIFDVITDRKKAEEELQMASLVYQTSNEAMTVTDEHGTILAVNLAFTKLTGYSATEVIGKNPRILQSGHHGKDFYETMWNALNTSGQWKGKIWNRRKNGDIYPEWLRINSTFNKDGSVHRRVALFSDITKEKELEELLWQHADIDLMTGLPNRRMFLHTLAQEIKKANRTTAPMALLVMDLDNFKVVNDTLGHVMGDLLLTDASKRLVSCVRNSDTVAHLGADDFTIILCDLQSPDSVERVALDVLQKLSAPFQLGDKLAYISVSIGIAVYPSDATRPDNLLMNANQALDMAKRQGKNRYHYFTAAMQEIAQARLKLKNDLHSAIKNNELRVYYQPIVELKTGFIHKAEALVRWQHPLRGMISPAEFIPVAEETGQIIEIGDWVFREAARQVKHLREFYEPQFQISVNKSPVQFRQNGSQHKKWFDYLQELNLPGESIIIEITEGLLMDVGANVTDRLDAFRYAGVQLSLDDFGTGYSSLSYLKRYALDYLKIDQSFVRNLSKESEDVALCEAIIVMAHKLGIKVIAEGVETEAQRLILAEAGCDYAQGYLFSKPVSGDDFETYINQVRLNAEIP